MKLRKSMYILFASLLLPFMGCEKEYEDESGITFFPVFEMEGESEMIHTIGVPYTDGSVTATEDGNPLDVRVSVIGEFTGYSGTTVDVDVIDKYVISYAATNADGYEGVATRTVFIAPPNEDMVTGLEGVYLANVQRTPAFAVLPQYSDMKYVYILKTGDKTYELSCALGGYYSIGRAYGTDFAFQGAVITANDIPANNFTISQATAPGFGNVADISSFTVDAVNKRITFTSTADFDNGVFHVQLEQVQY
ncbi:MAG: DUF5011 domain-containing protein [Bacteroidales bacterium]|nr:DUF5011 domain-containing protein [Bacteroidales bacterium]